MKKTVYSLMSALFLVTILAYTVQYNTPEEHVIDKAAKKRLKQYNVAERKKLEFLMLRDPKTNQIPENMRAIELEYAKTLPQRGEYVFYKGLAVRNPQALTWTERGPNNIAGRVRAFGIDIRTSAPPTLLAGGASGGMWKSTDGGTTWTLRTALSDLHSVTCLAQDTRAGQQDVWYYGTGENIGGSPGGEGASYFGNGVFKSTDNGNTWTKLAATNVTDNTSFNGDWQYVFNVAVHPTTGSVYAATTGGIYRSADGGATWAKVEDPGNTNTLRTDVTIAADGTVYYTAGSNGGTIAGVRKSVNDGTSWTGVNPSLEAAYGRSIIKTAPSNSSVVYVFIEGVTTGTNVHGHQLWYSTDAGASWTNKSTQIPASTAPNLDNFSTQNGYDMILSIKPDDPKFIIVGGVSIYKIHNIEAADDAMTLAQKHIGGYGMQVNGTANALGDFINHHPDNHYGVFLPGSNVKFYCANDGGIAVTEDITAASSATFWSTPIRTGLNIGQFYTVSLDKADASGFIAGGLQDRGNWMARTTGALQSWQEVGGGDGAFAEIEPSGQVFMSTTNGNIFRFTKTDATSPVGTTVSMKPATLQNPLFINPFDVDNTDGNKIYFGGGNSAVSPNSIGVWRSTNALAETPTWEFFTNSKDFAGDQVSFVQVSGNVLYIGTSGGKVYRLDDASGANASTATFTDISTGLPAGYVSSIAVDPANSANVMITFSNYRVNRVWHSTNSGVNWTNVGGNLNVEQGPSVRAVKMFSVGGTMHYFIGTSTGVYFTTVLDGASTVWTQEAATSIGNVVVVSLDFRASDGVLVAGTHGRGAFQTSITTPLPVELVSFTGVYDNNKVTLNWKTATESENYGFEIQRKMGNTDWTKIGFVQGAGNSNSEKNYSFTDKDIAQGKIQYRLKQFDIDGQFSYSNIVEVNSAVAIDFSLSQNYPNPFNPSTTINYSIPNASRVTLTVYDVTGRQVATLVDEVKEAGKYSHNFNASGLASGVYYYKVVAGKFTESRKMLLVK